MSLFFEYFIKPKHPTIATTATTAIIAIVVASPAFNILFAVVFDELIVFLALLAEPVSDIIAAITTTALFARFYNKNLC